MQDMSMENKLKQVCKAFNIAGDFISFEEIKVGNVNRTYRVNYVRDEDGKLTVWIDPETPGFTELTVKQEPGSKRGM